MGSRGLSSKSKGSSNKTPTKWELNSKNAKDYGIMLKKHNTNRISKENMQKAYDNLDKELALINQMGVLLGMRTDELPKVLMHYGEYEKGGTLGSTNMTLYTSMDVIDKKTGEVIFSPDAIIHLNVGGYRNDAGGLRDDELTTAAHEMMHAIEAKWGAMDFSERSERVNAWIDNMYSQAICHRALLAMGKQKDVMNIDDKVWKEQAQTIYRDEFEKKFPEHTYASSEGRGKYAETVTCTIEAALRYGEKNISPYGQAILKEIRREIKSHRTVRHKRRKGGKQ